MADNEKCNGWTNYHTWLLVVNIDTEQGLQEYYRDLLKDNVLQYDFYELVQLMKEDMEEQFYIEEHSIYKICDVWDSRSWHEIDFYEIVENWLTDIMYELDPESDSEIIAEIKKELEKYNQ